MFARVFTSVVVASLVVARGVPTSTTTNSQCDTGNTKCCKQVMNPTTAQAQELGGLLGLLNLGDLIGGGMGMDCTPINVLGLGNGADCTQQAVCCNKVSQSGWINLGCNPINVNL